MPYGIISYTLHEFKTLRPVLMGLLSQCTRQIIWKRERFGVLLPLLPHMVPLNDRNCCLTMPIVKGHRARGALPHTFSIGVVKYTFGYFDVPQPFIPSLVK